MILEYFTIDVIASDFTKEIIGNDFIIVIDSEYFYYRN